MIVYIKAELTHQFANAQVVHTISAIMPPPQPAVSQLKVLLGTTAVLAFCGITFYGPKQKKDGHNLFDIGK